MVTCHWDECTEKYNSEKQLYDHIQKKHVGYKRKGTLTNDCKWADCDFSCDRRDRMRSHILSHIDCKLFKCSSCDKKYKWRHDMLSHQRKAHNQDTSSRSRRNSTTPAVESSKIQPLAIKTDMYLPSQDRRNTLSNIDMTALSIARQNVANSMCDPESFQISPNDQFSPLTPLSLSRRESFASIPSRRGSVSATFVHSSSELTPLSAHSQQSPEVLHQFNFPVPPPYYSVYYPQYT